MSVMKSALLLVLLCLSLSVSAQTLGAPPPLELAAKSWVLYDYTSGQVLAEHDSDAHVEPASITKLMTGYLAFAAIKQGAEVGRRI